MARSFGVKTHHYKMLAFVYAALLAGLAGWLYAHEQRAVSPSTFGLNYGIEYLFMAIIGGFTSLWGAIFGAAMILVLRDQIQNIAPKLIGSNVNVEMVFFGIMMVLILQYARDGLIPLVVHWFRRFKDARKADLKSASTHLAYGVERLRLDAPSEPLAPRKNKKSVAIAAEEAILQVQKVRKEFGGLVAVNDISFQLHAGEIMGLIGPNGAGKSTTFKMLCGLLKPTEGEAQVVGLDLRRATGAAKAQLGYMAQKFSLYGLLSVRQNLEFSAGVYGLEGSTRRDRIAEMIETFDLADWLGTTPDALPLGHKQRLALACSLMHRPPVLFLDEPTSGVDPVTRREFWTHINGLARKGVTIMVTTHFMDEAEYCDRVALLSSARLIALDTPDALKRAAVAPQRPDPTMEDAFIHLVESADRELEAAT